MLHFLLALFILPPASSAILSSTSSALPFYRAQQSLFASGQASRELLEETLNRSELEVRFKVAWNKKSYDLKGTSLFRDIQLSKNVRVIAGGEILAERKSNSKSLQSISKDTALILLDCDEYWAFVQNPKNNIKGFTPLHLLQSKNEDSGYYINLIDTYLRKSSKLGSGIITTIPRLTRLEVIGIQKGWVEVKYNKQTGFADINHFVSRADFATLAFHPKHKWVTVTHRDNDFLVTSAQQKIPIKELWGMVTSAERAVIFDNSTRGIPPLRSQVAIVKPQAQLWGISRLPEHGDVWWQKSNLLLNNKLFEIKIVDEISTEQLIKRKLYSISFGAKDSLLGVASANGIYTTTDGIKWKPVAQFSDKNYPVSIHPDGAWFVGSYRSDDQGKSFDPFIRWDNLTKAIQSAYHRTPKILRLTKIESLPGSRVQIQVDTGIQSIKLRSHLLGDIWEVVRK